jgi:hypothetical protein
MGIKKCVKWKLLITERKILSWIFRPKRDRDCVEKIKNNDELNNLPRNTI